MDGHGRGGEFFVPVLLAFSQSDSAGLEVEALFADFGAGGEVGEALEGEELGGGAFAFKGEVSHGQEDGVMGFFGEIGFFARIDGIEVGEGEFLGGFDAGVDFVQAIEFGVEELEWFAGDFEGESFRARLGDQVEDLVIGAGAEPLGDLADFGFGEGGEGALFFHKIKG
jgi:hypothetical protein